MAFPWAGQTSTAESPSGIDTTPILPAPPDQFIERAARDIPDIMADIQPNSDRTIGLVAFNLAEGLRAKGHTLASAQWAIHELAQAGLLLLDFVWIQTPVESRFITSQWGEQFLVERGGDYVKVDIPKGKPTPFDSFAVLATELLWAWWHSEADGDAKPVATGGGAENASPRQGRRGRKKADYATEQREKKIADDWQSAKRLGTYRGEFAREKGMSVKDLDLLLGRVRKRTSRADK